MVPGIEVFGVRSLAQAVAVLRGEQVPDGAAGGAAGDPPLLRWRGRAGRPTSTSPTCTGWRTPALPSRSPPRAGTTCC